MAGIAITFLITDLHRGGSPLMLAALARGLKTWEGGGVFLPEVVSIKPLGEVAGILRASGVPVHTLEAAGNKDGRVVGRFVRHLRASNEAARNSGDRVERQGGGLGGRIVFSILVHANILAALARPVIEKESEATDGRGRGWVWVQSIHTVQARPRWHWWAQGVVGRFADAVVVPSNAVLRKLEGYGASPEGPWRGAKAGGGGGKVIPNGIEVQKFARAEAMPPAMLPWPRGAFVVGYVGRFDAVKRIEVLLEAVGELVRRDAKNPAAVRFSRLHVGLVGYGSLEAALRARAARLGIADRIHFPISGGTRSGREPQTQGGEGAGGGGGGGTREPERWMKTFDVFCSPSAAEGFGLTLLEARASGLRVIACRTAAVQETLAGDHEGGVLWLEREARVEEVAAAIERAMSLKGVVDVPAEVLRGWGVERMVERYAAWLQGIAGNHHRD